MISIKPNLHAQAYEWKNCHIVGETNEKNQPQCKREVFDIRNFYFFPY